MANKYSEELFGAVDTIIAKRLQSLNKDTTILCNIEDDTDAEKGKYIVSNSGLRFNAYTEKTDYTVGERVWVLIPDGDYENTKMIIGKNINYETDNFTWVNPLLSFVDMTGDICDSSAKGVLGLTANEPDSDENLEAQRIYLNSGLSVINSDLDQTSFEGLDKVAITASFKTFSSAGEYPSRGSFGLHFIIVTDKKMLSDNSAEDNKIVFDFDSSEMMGNPYNYETFLEQSYVFTFNPEEQGNIKDIYCYFYQNCDFYAGVNKFPYTLNNKVIPHNIFVNNLSIKLGYSSSKITGTTAMLWSTPTTFIVSSTESDYTRVLHPRLAYRRENGTYKYINTLNNFKELNREINNLTNADSLGEYPKIKFYKQDLTTGYSDKRAGDFYHEIDWNNETDINNFQNTVQLDNKTRELFKVAFIFKKNSAYTTSNRLDELAPTIGNNFEYTNDDKAAIQLFMDANYTSDEIFGVKNESDEYEGGYLQELIGTEFWDETWDYNSNLPTRAVILWDYIILISQKYFDNTLKINDNSVTIAQYLAQKDIYEKYTSYETDPWKNFEQNKSLLEISYVSSALTFTNSVTQESQIADLIQGLKLTATDDKKGTYIIYKATENANSELIKPSDALIKRTIEASFTSLVTGVDDFDAAARIYWLIPKVNTMIKEPAEGIGFGNAYYTLVSLSANEFTTWKNSGKVFYVLSNGKYNLVDSNTNYVETAKYYTETKEKLLLRSDETPPDNTSNGATITYDSIGTEENPISEAERTFLDNRPNFWVIVEDRTREDSKNRLKTASLIYQIKQFYRRSLTNNTIMAAIYKNKQIYTASIELFFGVKGTNGTDYALSIIPTFEKYKDNDDEIIINNSPNGWVFKSTTEYGLTAVVYDSNDELKTNDFEFNYSLLFSNGENKPSSQLNNLQGLFLDFETQTGSLISKPSISIKSIDDWTEIADGENGTSDKYIGCIIKCIASPIGETGINPITQYYILPVKTSRDIIYMDGPDTIVYDANGVNPEYYNIAYSLKDIEDQNIVLNPDVNERIIIKSFAADNGKFLPTIDDNGNLIPMSAFVADVNYQLYVKIQTATGEIWYQPILIILNSYGNTAICGFADDKPIKTSDEKIKTISSIMSITTANENGQLSGIVIGDLPADTDKERSGIIGYLNDDETYGLFSDGTGFIGKNKGVEINNDGTVTVNSSALPALPVASISDTGIVKLTSATNNDSETLAATAKAVKTAYDHGSTGISDAATAKLRADAAYDLASSKTSNLGTVTSIVASTGLSGGTITESGTIALANNYGDTKNPYSVKSANTILAGPASGNNASPSFRKLVVADIEDALNGIPIEKLKIKYNNITYNVTPIMLENGITVLALTL